MNNKEIQPHPFLWLISANTVWLLTAKATQNVGTPMMLINGILLHLITGIIFFLPFIKPSGGRQS